MRHSTRSFCFRYTLWVHYGRVWYIMVLMLGYTMLDYGVNTVYSHESSECHDYKIYRYIYIYNVYILCRDRLHIPYVIPQTKLELQVVYTKRILLSSLWLLFSERHTTMHKRRQGSGSQGKSQIRQFFLLFFYCFPACTGRHSRPFCRCSESCGTFDDWTELSHSGSLLCHIEKLGRRGLEYAFTAF